jgi:hypothetical protein
MTDRIARARAALDQLIEAAQSHLEAVTTNQGEPGDNGVWQAYVALNNAAYEYDHLLGEGFDEVTPFDVEKIADDGEGGVFAPALISVPARPTGDPHPRVVSVRQRRDYRVPSVAALLQVAPGEQSAEGEPVGTVGAAIIELLESGDGSLGMLDLPELEPLDGFVVVTEVDSPLGPKAAIATPADAPFQVGPGEAVLARLHEAAPTDAG